MTAADRTRAPREKNEDDSEEDSATCDDSAEVEDALGSGDESEGGAGPTQRELELERKNELLQRQIEQVKLLVLGLDKRMSEREEALAKTIERAENESRGLKIKLRELDLNQA